MSSDTKSIGIPSVNTQFGPEVPNVNWNTVRKDFDQEVDAMMQEFSAELERQWTDMAKVSMASSADRYMEGVSFNVRGDNVDVTIEGWLPVALESGSDAFDMKPGHLKTRSLRVIRLEKTGEFRTMSTRSAPWSWWHPGIQARSIANRMESEVDNIIEKTVTPRVEDFFARQEI